MIEHNDYSEIRKALDFITVVYAVDFDGTIVVHEYPEIGESIPGSFETLLFFKSLGIKLILWTCRMDQYLADAVNFCKERGLVFDAVNQNLFKPVEFGFPKVSVDAFIDDTSFENVVQSKNGNFTKEKWDWVREKGLDFVENKAEKFMVIEKRLKRFE